MIQNSTDCALIKVFVKKGLKAVEIHNEMVNELGDVSPSKTMVCKFQRGCSSHKDDPRCGHAKRVTIEI